MNTEQTEVKEWVVLCESNHKAPGAFPDVYTIRKTSDPGQLLEGYRTKLREEYEETCLIWTDAAWKNQFGVHLRDTSDTVQLVTWEQFEQMQRDHLLGDNPIKLETYKGFMDSLEVLPPEKWENEDGFERFLMSEYYTGSFTAQHARCRLADGKSVCGSRLVDASDKTTWITRDELLKAHETQEPPQCTFTYREARRALFPGDLPTERCRSDFSEYDGVELHGTVSIIDEDTGETYIERIADVDMAELLKQGCLNEVIWTIYGTQKDAETLALFDFHTNLEADSALLRLKDTVLNPYHA